MIPNNFPTDPSKSEVSKPNVRSNPPYKGWNNKNSLSDFNDFMSLPIWRKIDLGIYFCRTYNNFTLK